MFNTHKGREIDNIHTHMEKEKRENEIEERGRQRGR